MQKYWRIRVCMTVVLLLGMHGALEGARSSFSQAIFVTAGVTDREGVAGNTVYTIGWEGWIVPCRAFGFYLDASLYPDDGNALATMSYGITLRTPGFSDFKPYLMLGFLFGKTESKEEHYAMPLTLGAEYWLSEGLGVRAHARYQFFARDTVYSLQGGVFFRL